MPLYLGGGLCCDGALFTGSSAWIKLNGHCVARLKWSIVLNSTRLMRLDARILDTRPPEAIHMSRPLLILFPCTFSDCSGTFHSQIPFAFTTNRCCHLVSKTLFFLFPSWSSPHYNFFFGNWGFRHPCTINCRPVANTRFEIGQESKVWHSVQCCILTISISIPQQVKAKASLAEVELFVGRLEQRGPFAFVLLMREWREGLDPSGHAQCTPCSIKSIG